MMKKIISKMSALVLATSMAISPLQVFAADDYSDKSLFLNNEQSIEALNSVEMFDIDGFVINDEVSPIGSGGELILSEIPEMESSEDANETTDSFVGIQPTVSNIFSWNSSTVAFNPSTMQATTDIDIVWDKFVGGSFNTSYDFWGTGYGSMIAKTTYNTQSKSDYTTYLNEGHINDYFGAYGQPHTYVSVNSSGYNYITMLAGWKVRALVFTSNGQLCFDSGYGTSGNYRSPAGGSPVTSWNADYASGFGSSSKDLYYIQLQPGTYYVAFMNYNNYPIQTNNVDTLDNGFYYAFYTGKALPAQKQYTAMAHTGSVYWNGVAGSSVTSAVGGITLSADSSIASLYAVNGVKFVDFKPIGSGDYLYIDSVTYQYTSPNSTSWRSVSGYQGGDFVDYSPSTGSIIGSWQWRYNVTWSRNLAYVGASFFANTRIYIDYLVPYGSTL